MKKNLLKFKHTRQYFNRIGPDVLEMILHDIMPGLQFRFFTFESGDYENGSTTLYLYNFIPDRVFVTVDDEASVDAAIANIVSLNPGIVWERGPLDYIDSIEGVMHRTTQELRILSIPMYINAAGILIMKYQPG